MPNLHNHDFIAYVEHIKKSCSNKEDTSTISQNLSGSLSKPRIFIGDGTICKDSTWQQSPNHLRFLSLYYEVNPWHHARFQLFFDFFYIFKFFDNGKIHFWCGSTQLFGILPCLFFLNKASTCGEDHKRDFPNHFYPLISVLVVQIWITCIQCKNKAVNHLNIANEPRKCQTCTIMFS